jgi:hypothetical protein
VPVGEHPTVGQYVDAEETQRRLEAAKIRIPDGSRELSRV